MSMETYDMARLMTSGMVKTIKIYITMDNPQPSSKGCLYVEIIYLYILDPMNAVHRLSGNGQSCRSCLL